LRRSNHELSQAELAFARKAISQTRRRVLVHGLTYFGEAFSDFMSGDGWEFVYYPDGGVANLVAMGNALRRCDLVYQFGGRVTVGRFLSVARLLRKKRIVMHWVGSDTLEAQTVVSSGRCEPWVLNAIHHWADSPWILKEVGELGVGCEYVPLPSPRIPNSPAPLPEEFKVLVYVPSVECTELYGLDKILEAARALPDVRFELVGLRDGPLESPPENIRFHKRVPDLAEYYKQATVVWRPTRHDGLSWMVCEALGHGRHVLWSYPFTGCTLVRSTSEAIAEIQNLQRLHRAQKLNVNCEGVDFISAGDFFPGNFKKNILCHLGKILASIP
jgi:glycosyltransferase involved in cell wall biosynthesis